MEDNLFFRRPQKHSEAKRHTVPHRRGLPNISPSRPAECQSMSVKRLPRWQGSPIFKQKALLHDPNDVHHEFPNVFRYSIAYPDGRHRHSSPCRHIASSRPRFRSGQAFFHRASKVKQKSQMRRATQTCLKGIGTRKYIRTSYGTSSRMQCVPQTHFMALSLIYVEGYNYQTACCRHRREALALFAAARLAVARIWPVMDGGRHNGHRSASPLR